MITLTVNTLSDWCWWDTTHQLEIILTRKRKSLLHRAHSTPAPFFIIYMTSANSWGGRHRWKSARGGAEICFIFFIWIPVIWLSLWITTLQRNFNQVGRGFPPQGFSFQSAQSSMVTQYLPLCSVRLMATYILWAFLALRRSCQCHDCPIEPSFKVRGHLSIIVPVSITAWPLWPSREMKEMQIFCCRRNSFHKSKHSDC